MTKQCAIAGLSRRRLLATPATPNAGVNGLLTACEKRDLIATPEVLKQIIEMNPAWIEANRASGLERWNYWISS